MFCKNCGNQMAEDARFCPNCGADNGDVQPNQFVQPIYVKPRIPGRGLGIAGMVLGIIGSIYAFIFLMNMETFESVNTLSNDVDSLAETTFNSAFITAIVIYSVLNILAVSLAGAGRSKGYRNGISTSGVVLGVIGLIMNVATIALV